MTRRRGNYLLLLLLFPILIHAQPGAGYQANYRLLHSDNLVADKNFYWLTVIGKTPALQQVLANRPLFDALVDKHLRPSGYYQRFIEMSNQTLFSTPTHPNSEDARI